MKGKASERIQERREKLRELWWGDLTRRSAHKRKLLLNRFLIFVFTMSSNWKKTSRQEAMEANLHPHKKAKSVVGEVLVISNGHAERKSQSDDWKIAKMEEKITLLTAYLADTEEHLGEALEVVARNE